MLTLPIVQLLAVGLGQSTQSAHAMRDVLRVLIALSTIPSSIAGLAVISSGALVQRQKLKTTLNFLNLDDVSALETKTVDELHYLIEVALKRSNVEIADRISLHILRRAEGKPDLER